VTLVVVAVDHPVPAGWEHEFKSETVGTVGISESFIRHIMSEKRCLGVLVIVQAVETNGSLFQVRLASLLEKTPARLRRIRREAVSNSIVAAEVASSNHLESSWECRDIAATREVVAVKSLASICIYMFVCTIS
jgi:hypothetical protein